MRTVVVALRARVSEYRSGIASSRAETEQLADTVDDLAGELRRASGAADAAGDAADDLAEQARQAARGVDELGDEARGTVSDLERLDRQIAETRAEMAGLARQFAETGDADTLARYKKLTAQLGELGRVAKTVGDDEEIQRRRRRSVRSDLASLRTLSGWSDVGSQAASGLGQMLPGAVSTLGPALVVAAGAAAPLVGAAVAEGILLAVGGAGIAAGIASAFKSDEVARAWTRFGDEATTQFTAIGVSFQKPVITALDEARTRLGGLHLERAIEPLASVVVPLERGLMGLAERAMPGVERAAHAAAKPVKALAAELPDVGDAFSDALSAASIGAGGATRAMEDLLKSVEAVTVATGATVGALAKIYEVADVAGLTGMMGALGGDGMDKLKGSASDTTGVLIDLGQQADAAMQQASAAAQRLAEDLDAVKQKADTAWGSQMGLDEATLALNEGMRTLSEAVRDNGASLEMGTEKGNANRETLLGLVGNVYSLYDAEIAAGVGISTASGHLQANLAALADNAAKAGFNRDQINQLLAAYVALSRSPDINKYVNVYYRKVGGIEGEPASSSYGDIPTGKIGGQAAGGPVVGPGTGTSDSILRMLSNGEHVWTAQEVAATGGHAAVAALRRAALMGSHLGSGGTGGGVTVVVNQTINAGIGADAAAISARSRAAIVDLLDDYRASNPARRY